MKKKLQALNLLIVCNKQKFLIASDTMKTEYKQVLETYIRKVDRLVHLIISGEEIITTVDYPFYVQGRGFIDAGNLLVGDKLVSSIGEDLLIENYNIEETENLVDVYNFQVKDNHTYYVGCQSILVHNADKYSTNITPEMEKKILEGQRVGTTNRVKGGYSPTINDANPNYAVETLRNNPDGTTSVKYVKLLSDGNISKIKKAHYFLIHGLIHKY